jgi:hypothetical protein
MIATTSKPEYDSVNAAKNYDWASHGSSTIVDVGGAHGHIDIELLKQFKDLKVIVQDLQSVVDGAAAQLPALPEDVRSHLNFQAHGFCMPQTAKADVYFLQWVVHTWSDEYAVQILQALVLALEPDARLVVMYPCMRERGTVPLWKEKSFGT